MGYHFRATGPAKSRELDNAKPAETPEQDVGALITAGGKEDCKAIPERNGLQLVKLNTQFCTYALLSPHIHKGMSQDACHSTTLEWGIKGNLVSNAEMQGMCHVEDYAAITAMD